MLQNEYLWSKGLRHQQQTAFENIVGKKETARNKQFLFFPKGFLLNQKILSPFVNIFDILSLFAAELEEPRIGIRLVQIESIYRPKNKHDSKFEFCFGKGRKHLGKRRKCWLPAFSPFPTIFPKAFSFKEITSQNFMVKS